MERSQNENIGERFQAFDDLIRKRDEGDISGHEFEEAKKQILNL